MFVGATKVDDVTFFCVGYLLATINFIAFSMMLKVPRLTCAIATIGKARARRVVKCMLTTKKA